MNKYFYGIKNGSTCTEECIVYDAKIGSWSCTRECENNMKYSDDEGFVVCKEINRATGKKQPFSSGVNNKSALQRTAKMHIDNEDYGFALTALNQLQQIQYKEYYDK